MNIISHVLFQLYGSGRLAGQIEHYAVDSLYFAYDSAHTCLLHFKRDIAALCRHEIGCVYGTQYHSIVIRPEVSHDTYGTHIGKCSKILAGALYKFGLVNLLADYALVKVARADGHDGVGDGEGAFRPSCL